jgi:hypothetical protein
MGDNSLGFFRAIGKSQSYLNMLYLLAAFPLGLIYFIFIVTGVSVGLGLFITLLGIPILLGVMYAWIGFAHFERKFSSALLGVKIPYLYKKEVKGKSFWEKLKKRMGDSNTWKDFAYLMIKFPLGIFSFVILVTFISVTLALIAYPFVYYLHDIGVIAGSICSGGLCGLLNNYPIAIFIGLFGILLIFVSLAVFNGLAYISGLLAKELLSRKVKRGR